MSESSPSSTMSFKEKLYGNFPPARDIRQRDRQMEIGHARKSLEKLWQKERESGQSTTQSHLSPSAGSAGSYCRYAARANNDEGSTVHGTTRRPQRDGILKLIDHTGQKSPGKGRGKQRSNVKMSAADDDMMDVFHAVDKKRLEKKRFEKDLERFNSENSSLSGPLSMSINGSKSGDQKKVPRADSGEYKEGGDQFRVEHTDCHMTTVGSPRHKHFFVSPDWVSEQLSVKRMSLANRPNPLKYGWI